MPDAFPHETAVAWCRSYLKKHLLKRGSLDAMENELKKKLADVARYINRTHDVQGLQAPSQTVWYPPDYNLEGKMPGQAFSHYKL